MEGKGTRDPLEIPFGGRRMSAVDQCYRYAINLPCDWIIVTSMRETRLYHKGSNQQTYERFETVRLAADDGLDSLAVPDDVCDPAHAVWNRGIERPVISGWHTAGPPANQPLAAHHFRQPCQRPPNSNSSAWRR